MHSEALLASCSCIAGRYLLHRRLGAGGMGEVYLAYDSALERSPVAIKFLYPHLVADTTALSRFRNEVLVARRLIHPTIVRTFNLEVADSRAIIVMEYVEGVTLRELLHSSFPTGMPLERLAYFAAVIAHGMHHSHQMGVIHRDLKPDNIIVSTGDEVKLSDFGLAATLRRQTQLTRAGHLMGTPYYMAPEQFRGETVAVTADIYSFGIMLYELALGHVPFTDSSIYGLARQHEQSPISLPADRRALLPAGMWQIITQATEKRPEARFQGFDEIIHALAHIVDTPGVPSISSSYSSAPDDGAVAMSGPPPRRICTWPRIASAYLLFVLLMIQQSRANVFSRGVVAVPLLRAEALLNTRLEGLRAVFGVTVDFTSRNLADEQLLGSNTASVRVLAGDDANAERNRNKHGEYALHIAASKSNVVGATILLLFGADPNLTAHDGRTALHHATLSHDVEIATLLLKHGASPDAVARNGTTPLLVAAQTGDEPMAVLLLKAGADPNRVDREGQSAITYATTQGKSEFLRELAAHVR